MLYLNGREPLSVELRKKSVVINGVEYFQHKQGKKRTNYFLKGVFYDTVEELMVAKMLYWMKISFLHHVNFPFLLHPDDKEETIWCPDFVLECPFRWVGKVCNGSVVVGLEVKHKSTVGRPRQKSKALIRELGIPIILLSRRDIKPFFNKDCMTLPLRSLEKDTAAA